MQRLCNNQGKIKIKYELNKRGKVILLSLLFSLSVVTTVLIIGAVKSGKENQQTAGTQTDTTEEPSITPTGPQATDEQSGTESVLSVTPTPTTIIRAKKFDVPKEGVRLVAIMIGNIDGVTKEAGGVYWDLTRDKNNYHDSYTSAERLNKFISNVGYETKTTKPLPLTYNKDDLDLSEAKEAKEVFIKYSTVSPCGFYYDSNQKN